MKKYIYNILICVFAAIFLFSAYTLFQYYREARKSQSEFQELANLVADDQIATEPHPTNDSVDPADPTVPVNVTMLVDVTNPQTGKTATVLRQYAPLYRLNSDIVGWMRIEGTPINYPVMQTPDSADYYLKRNFDKEYSSHGCLYVRESCSVSTSDNITIYGHHMRDGSMFGCLSKYKDPAFWEAHSVITFDTLTQQQTFQILSVFLTTASIGQGFDYHLFDDAADEAEYDAFVSTCKSLSLYDTGVDAQYGEQLITLSTCDYTQVNGRLVVVAKRIEG